MTMFERMHRGLELAKGTLFIFSRNKSLILFPLISGIAILLVIASFIFPIILTGFISDIESSQLLAIVILFLFYLVCSFIGIFFNAGLIAAVRRQMRGEETSFTYGVQVAAAHLPQILFWAVITATVGVILQLIRNESQGLGQIITSIIGAAWSLVTFFVIPVFIVENISVIASIRSSWELFRRTWGETVTGQFSLGFIILPFILILILAFFSEPVVGAFYLPVIGIAVLLFAAAIVFINALQGIFVAMMYEFATSGTVPEGIDRDLLENAYAPKQR